MTVLFYVDHDAQILRASQFWIEKVPIDGETTKKIFAGKAVENQDREFSTAFGAGLWRCVKEILLKLNMLGGIGTIEWE
ncbi:hypothetical protein [Methylocystis echinoides]|uniref:hypothetical protein n=1 Tax=Methylocystis echinoides TaxID=29468 RepID=UPI00248FAB52|nr:hypothetical protein [Methylocystis echinoides]